MFLEVYADIIEKAKEGKSVGPYSLNDLANRLSPSIASATDDGTLFDVTITRFRTLKERSLTLIQSHLKKEIFEELRQYTNLYQTPFITTLNSDSIGPPSELKMAKNSVTLQLPILANCLSSPPRNISLHLPAESSLSSSLPPSL